MYETTDHMCANINLVITLPTNIIVKSLCKISKFSMIVFNKLNDVFIILEEMKE